MNIIPPNEDVLKLQILFLENIDKLTLLEREIFRKSIDLLVNPLITMEASGSVDVNVDIRPGSVSL